jgi:hypothetical protein
MNVNSIPIFNMTLPAEGPVSVPMNFDMALLTSYDIDLTQAINDKVISFISGAWVDNSDNAQALTITCDGTNQAIIFPASKQGWIPLYITNPPKLRIEQAAVGGFVKFLFVNFPVFPYIIGN